MIKENIKPTKNSINFQIPDEYINEDLIVIIMKTDENQQTKPSSQSKKEISSLGGVLSKYADLSKRDLEDSAWELHVADKYK